MLAKRAQPIELLAFWQNGTFIANKRSARKLEEFKLSKKVGRAGSLSMKDCFLIVDSGSGPNTVYPLLDEETIGRSADNSISLPDKTVSRKHARVVFQEGAWIVEDLGSANGIIFNDERVERIVLSSGDIFKIGKYTLCYEEKDIPEARDQFFETITIL